MTREEAIWYPQPIADSASLPRYAEALNMAIAALKEQTVTNCHCLNGWISVEDRLPEEAGKCIVHDVVLGVQVYFYHPDMVCSNWRSVTHWMPLPEPPEVPDQ